MRRGSHFLRGPVGFAALAAVLLSLPLAGCGSGSDGAPGAPGSSTGTVSGQVTNAMTSAPLSNIEVEFTPAASSGPVMTDAGGNYSVTLPIGAYTIVCDVSGYVPHTHHTNVVADGTTTLDMAMDPEVAVKVTITGATAGAAPGSTLTLSANVDSYDGSTPTGYLWTQTQSAPANIATPTAQSTAVTLGTMADYKQAILSYQEDLDRWRVQPINPHAAIHGAGITIQCAVTTGTGTYTGSVDISADLPFDDWATGIRNVAPGLSVMLDGKDQGSYSWSITTAPGTPPTLNDADTENPWFVPTATGVYQIEVPDLTGTGLPNAVIDLYVGNWTGGVDGETLEPDPFEPWKTVSMPTMNACVGCHGGSPDWNAAYDGWRRSGHAHIFSNNINAGGHYNTGCFECHTVGYHSGGIDAQTDYGAFLDAVFPGGHIHGDPDNWTNTLANQPLTAGFANIQCEHCHGPNDLSTGAHNWTIPYSLEALDHPRMSYASDVCAYCHGEPPRHARFQQWEESKHGNYETAIEEGTRTYCAKCHTAQGYIAWWEGESIPSLEADEIHPITCAVCHDTHFVGTTSGHGTNAPMRVEDNYYNSEAGFDMTNVGKGAMCMSCHNGRRGLQNDAEGISHPDRAPHGGPQSDVLFGENAFFVDVGQRGPHGYIADTCVTCHVELTPPPAELSYNLGGRNHTFEAKLSICADCHGAFDPANLLAQAEDSMEELKLALEQAFLDEITTILALTGWSIEFNDADTTDTFTITSASQLTKLELIETHGRSGIEVSNGSTTVHARLGSGGPPRGTIIWDSVAADRGSLVSNGLFFGEPEVDLAKATYNYWLLHSDGSHSVHNPGFFADVVAASLDVVDALTWALLP